jgi:predicted DNA-binding transcriptional regulator YafY
MAKKKPVATKLTGSRAPKPHPVPTRPEAQRRLRQADRLARILRLLQLIQRRGQWDAEAIARELECSVRTVYRDLTVLELAGVPWMFDKDTGGYRVRSDYHFPVLQLTNEELIGQATATVTSKASGLDITEGAGPTSEKLATSSGKESEEILREAQRFIEVLDLKLADHSRHLDCVRTVHPYRLCLIKSAWYLIAKTAGEPEPRTYRIVRLKSLRMTDKPAVIPRGFDLRDYFGNAWGVYRGQDTHDVELLFSKEAAEVVSETVWHHTQKSQRNADGSLTMTFTVDGLDEIVRWIVGWSGRVKVIAPNALREKVVEEHRRAIAANS